MIAEPGEPIATVGLGERVNPANAPRPSNESERLLFRQLYETLVLIDCNGHVGPGLAASWRLDTHGRAWIVTLREDARFSDGTPVTATDVRASWTVDGFGHELRSNPGRLIESVVPVDDRTLAITLRSKQVDAPLALAHTDLAIARFVAASPWPLGTRFSRISTESAPGAAPVIVLDRDGFPSVRFLVATDVRDLLDHGVDLLMTREPVALDYAATSLRFHTVPLAWQRTHVLLIPGRTPHSTTLSDGARKALADDAVRGEARGAERPSWWQALPDCNVVHSLPREASRTTRLVYDAGDATARDLAERLVGLAHTADSAAAPILEALRPDHPHRTFERATGLTGEALARAFRLGTDAGYIVAIDGRPIDPCRDLRILTERTPWLDPETIVPLVETRLHVIVQRGRSGVRAEWDGGLLLAPRSGPR